MSSTTAAPTTAAPTTSTTQSRSPVIYRVNVGGSRLSAMNGGPDWLPDSEQHPSRFGNALWSGSHTNTTDDSVAMTAAVPAGTPEAIFHSRRWDADTKDHNDDTEMQYRFPVENGQYEVRLYFAETYLDDYLNRRVGPRKFSVEIGDEEVLHDYDMYKELGHDRGTMKSFTVKVEEGVINVRFKHKKEDPMLSGISIVRVESGKEKNGHQQ
ncbi:hypothetical protein BG842_17930 [Haladaptatus sp. W1]|nr:hypothetical protein BG842_17930 [Haladaptatus sp. W1]